MSTELDKLRRRVDVLLEGIREAMERHFEREGAQSDRAWDDLDDAIAAADRIAAEPTEPTSAEVVDMWVSSSPWLSLDLVDHGTRESRKAFGSVAEAAAWVRSQGAAQ